MPTPSNAPAEFATATNGGRSKSARRERNRRRAKDLSDEKLREVKRDFEITRNTLESAQNHLLPRAEAVDGVLIRLVDEYRSVRQELTDLRRQLGIDPSRRPFLVQRVAA